MARPSVQAICDLSDAAWTHKDNTAALLRECYEHALPDHNPYQGTGRGKPQGATKIQGRDKSSSRVFDSTLMNDTIKLANRLQYELFPIGHQWASFIPGAFIEAQYQTQAAQELHALQQLVFTAIELSNFDLAIAEWLLELVVTGTAVMLVSAGDDDNPVIYQPVTLAHVALREGALGKVDLISRVHKMRHSLVAETWLDAKMPPLGEDEDDPEVDLVDVCHYSVRDKVWYYDVILTGGMKGHKRTSVVKREYDMSPWVVARWHKAAEEVQGRSLVMQALPDARVLSAIKNYLLRHAALAVGGVYLVRNDGVINANNVRVFPGATIPVQSTGGPNASMAPLPVGGDVNLAQLVLRDLQTSIHRTMLNDGMPAVDEGVRTATELIERMKELQQSLGAPFARVLKEGILPLLEVTIALLGKAGVIPVTPGNNIKLNGGQVKVKFASPLVQGQSLREVETLQQAAVITQQIAGPEGVQLSFKVEDVGAWVGGKLGVVPTLIRSPTEREDLQKKAGAMAAANQNGELAVGGAGGVMPNAPQPAAGGQMAA